MKYDSWLTSTLPDTQDPDAYLESRGWTRIGKRKDGTMVWKFREVGGSCIILGEDEAVELQEKDDQRGEW